MDKGVFYLDNDAGSWTSFNTGLPFQSIKELAIDYVGNEIIAATYGRGIWSSDLPDCNYANTTLTISTTATWTTPYFSTQDISVEPGVTLTIKNYVYMPSAAKIIVKRGAQLIIDGGTITSACQNVWKGIEVWGDNTLRQLTSLQGKVSIVNSGSVQNADVGIATILISGTTPNLSYTGGIIQCTNAIFRNNIVDVKFYPYQNKTAGGSPISNISVFSKCTFETTSNLLAGSMPSAHVNLSDVSVIKFAGCNFRNSAIGISTYPANLRGAGIVSTDAGYSVDQACSVSISPCPSYLPTRFDGLTEGINASYAVSSLRNIIVNGSVFDNTQRGIKCIAGAYNSVTANTFSNIPLAQTNTITDATYGIYMIGATNFSIASNNQFTGAGTAGSYYNNYGVIIENSANTASQLFGNTFANLFACTQTQQNNGSGGTGLKLSCNAYNTAYRYAWSINPTSPSGSIANQGEGCALSLKQAGNTWNYSSVLTANQINSTIPLYYYAGAGSNTVPIYVSSPPVVVNSCSPANTNSSSCVVGGGGGGKMAGVEGQDLVIAKDPEIIKGRKLFEQNEKIRHFLAQDSIEAAIALLEADNSLLAKKILLGEYLSRKDLKKAQLLFNKINGASADEQNITDYYNIIADLTKAGKTISQIDAFQENQLWLTVGSGSEMAYNAKVALLLAKNKAIPFPIERFADIGDAGLKRAQNNLNTNSDSKQPVLSDNYPNPFNETTIINSFVPESSLTSLIIISDPFGHLIAKYKLQSGNNTTEVSCKSLSAGIYYYSLEIDGNRLATKKMVLVH